MCHSCSSSRNGLPWFTIGIKVIHFRFTLVYLGLPWFTLVYLGLPWGDFPLSNDLTEINNTDDSSGDHTMALIFAMRSEPPDSGNGKNSTSS